MKKIKLLFIGLVLLFISTMFAEEITIYTITPSILLPWIIYIAIALDYKYCLTYTFIVSLANDLLNPQLLGFTTMLNVLLCHFVCRFHTSVNKDKYSTIFLSMLVINTVLYAIQWGYFAFTHHAPFLLLSKTLLTIGYNTILSCVLLFVIFLCDKVKIILSDY